MNRLDDSSRTPAQPALADLLARYLQRQVTAHAEGLASTEALGEVVPFEAAPVQPVDARLAWEEALRVLPFYRLKTETRSWSAPPHWSQLVAAHEPAITLAFCLGNFPQLVRNFQPLLHAAEPAKLRPASGRPVAVPALLDWAAETATRKQFPQTLLALGALRLARQFDRATELVQAAQAQVPAEWRAGWANETAALAWHAGRADEALALWEAQPGSVPVLFNRGMAALFLDRPAEARPLLSEAVAQLPEAGAWHHLGQLYLTLAETRS
jgi:tetratricopeptide (TPR) repeat protein